MVVNVARDRPNISNQIAVGVARISKVSGHYNQYKLIPNNRVYMKKDMQSLIHAMSL